MTPHEIGLERATRALLKLSYPDRDQLPHDSKMYQAAMNISARRARVAVDAYLGDLPRPHLLRRLWRSIQGG